MKTWTLIFDIMHLPYNNNPIYINFATKYLENIYVFIVHNF
jgi:hypothetical protein